jgi:hypothetical protein
MAVARGVACRKFGHAPNARQTSAQKMRHGVANCGRDPNAPLAYPLVVIDHQTLSCLQSQVEKCCWLWYDFILTGLSSALLLQLVLLLFLMFMQGTKKHFLFLFICTLSLTDAVGYGMILS